MNIILKANQPIYSGEIDLPSSKSITNRVLIIRALANSKNEIYNIATSDDSTAMVHALSNSPECIDIGAAGTTMRFLTAYYAITPGSKIITGSARMKERPIAKLVDALKALGATINYVEKEGYPPLKILGKDLTVSGVEIDGSISSQYISALLMIAPRLKNGLKITLKNEIISTSYIHMTLSLMKIFGIESQWINNSIEIKHQSYQSKTFTVEADWSSASYWFQLVALTNSANIILKGLNFPSVQGDSKIIDLFKLLGVQTSIANNEITLTSCQTITSTLDIDFKDIPDMVQTFAVTCVLKKIPFRFTGTQSLLIKETNRIVALQVELQKFGAHLEFINGTLSWSGKLKAIDRSTIIHISTYDDHRMALAFAPAAVCGITLSIENPTVVNKSYPDFWEHLKKVGFAISAAQD